MAACCRPPPGHRSSEAASREEQDEAVAAAWGWYREWSQIARTVITRADMLVRLGLRRRAATDAPPEAAPPAEEPADA